MKPRVTVFLTPAERDALWRFVAEQVPLTDLVHYRWLSHEILALDSAYAKLDATYTTHEGWT